MKRRIHVASYDSSSDIFKLNLVYKDQKGVDRELKWVIKVCRSDVNDVASALLRQEKQFYSRLVSDLINTVKQKSAGFLENARVSPRDLILTPEFIYEETAHQADISRHVLVLDNLEERQFYGIPAGVSLNLPHFRIAVKTIAKIHAVGICHKLMLFHTFQQQETAALSKKTCEDVELDGAEHNKVLVGKEGLFARFPFIGDRCNSMNFLISNRHTFLNMYHQFLRCFPKEEYLIDIFDYMKISVDDILEIHKVEPEEGHEDAKEKYRCNSTNCDDHPLESICLGVLDSRSFLYFYEEEDNKENIKSMPKGTKIQRSHSDRASSRKSVPVKKNDSLKSKSPQVNNGLKSGKLNNKLFQNVKKSQDDAIVPPLKLEKKAGPANPLATPLKAAIVNAKYVTYNKVTSDLAVLFFTCGDTTIRRFYMIKMLTDFAETLGITLSSLGVDTDQFRIKWQEFIQEFQSHLLYGFMVGVLVAMANTDVNELNEFIKNSGHPDKSVVVEGPKISVGEGDIVNRAVKLSPERVSFLLDLMKDIGSYVESKDFELGLTLTNFARYQELWSMNDAHEGDDYGEEEEEEEE